MYQNGAGDSTGFHHPDGLWLARNENPISTLQLMAYFVMVPYVVLVVLFAGRAVHPVSAGASGPAASKSAVNDTSFECGGTSDAKLAAIDDLKRALDALKASMTAEHVVAFGL